MEILTHHQIIDETVEYYSNNPRSVRVDGFCLYLGPNGEKCAFSRCLTDEGVAMVHFHENTRVGHEYLIHLKSQYQGKSVKFWRDLQRLHDNQSHWDNKELTSIGKQYVEYLKNEYL